MLDANSRERTYPLALNFILIERERIERFSIENTDALSKIRDSKISTVGRRSEKSEGAEKNLGYRETS